MAAYIFAIVGLLIVIPILSFLPLNFSNRGTIVIGGISFIAALLFILLQNVLDIWTALLAGVAIILISSIVLNKKGESFMMEPAEVTAEGEQESASSDVEEHHEISNQSDNNDKEEQADILIHKEQWLKAEHVTEPEEISGSFEESGTTDDNEHLIEQIEINRTEESELNEVDEILESRQKLLLREQAIVDDAVEEKANMDNEKSLETAETIDLKNSDRSWLESAAAFDTDAEATGNDLKASGENAGDLIKPNLSQDEKLFFSNLELEEDDDQNEDPEKPQYSEIKQLNTADISEKTSSELNVECRDETTFSEEDMSILSNEKEDPVKLIVIEKEENTVAAEESVIDSAEHSEKLHADVGKAETTTHSLIIDEQIFHLITSELENYDHPDVKILENEIRETLKLTTDTSQQYVLYRILIEQMIQQDHIPEVLSLSQEVTLKFDHEFIKDEMHELRNIL